MFIRKLLVDLIVITRLLTRKNVMLYCMNELIKTLNLKHVSAAYSQCKVHLVLVMQSGHRNLTTEYIQYTTHVTLV